MYRVDKSGGFPTLFMLKSLIDKGRGYGVN